MFVPHITEYTDVSGESLYSHGHNRKEVVLVIVVVETFTVNHVSVISEISVRVIFGGSMSTHKLVQI